MVTDLVVSAGAAASLGTIRPLAVETTPANAFKEHMKDVKFDGEKLGNQITKFAKSLDIPKLKEALSHKRIGENMKELGKIEALEEALSHKRIGEVMDKLEQIKDNIPEDKRQEFEGLQTKFNSWMEERGHNPETKHLRSGEERILDITPDKTGKLPTGKLPIKYNEKNNGDSLTECDKAQVVNQKQPKPEKSHSARIHPEDPSILRSETNSLDDLTSDTLMEAAKLGKQVQDSSKFQDGRGSYEMVQRQETGMSR